MHVKRYRRGSRAPQINYFKRHTCNTIDDVTGMKVKLSETFKRWDGVVTTKLNMEERQPQDFPVTPVPQHVYREARFQLDAEVPTPFDPADGWADLTDGVP